MADSFTMEIKGLKELANALEQLPKQISGKIIGGATKGASILIQNQARENARAIFKDPTGATEKSIVAWRRRGSKPDDITYDVGVTLKKKWPRKRTHVSFARRKKTSEDVMQPAYWWRFSELGTVKQGATPWLRPAFDLKSGEALAYIRAFLKRGIQVVADNMPKYRGD